MGTRLHPFVQIVSGGILLFLVYCCLLFLLQRQIVFPRNQIRGALGAPANHPSLEQFWLDLPYGKVEAWFLPPELEGWPAPAVIFAHGNAELIDFWVEDLRGFTRLGVGVLLVEYPGYGRSEGSPSQEGIVEAFVSGYDTLVAREDIDASRIVLFGRSLGAGVVCALAEKRPSAALILMSPFTSVRALAARMLFPGFLVRDPFDNLAVVSAYSKPVLVIHGTHDEIIPYGHGEALARVAQQGKLVSYEAGHNDIPPRWDVFWRDVEAFLGDTGILDVR